MVTVIMPVRNEGGYIQRSLHSVLQQDYPPGRYEVIVSDGMSHDGTRGHIQNLQRCFPNLYLIDNPQMIVPTGLNLALGRARGEIIIRIDGHCEIAPDYIARCVQHLLEDQVDCVGGPIETIGETYAAQAIALGMSSPFGVGDSAFRTVNDRAMLVDSVAFPAYSREAIDKTGLFDEELVRNQDDEYNYRLRKLGGKILLSPDIRSRYFSRSSLISLWHQYFQYGYWKVRVLQKHPRQMRLRQFVPPIFVLTLLASVTLAAFDQVGRLLFALTAGSYTLANLSATMWFASRKGWRYLPFLPIVFTILHVGYGLGFLVGLFKFAPRWGIKQ